MRKNLKTTAFTLACTIAASLSVPTISFADTKEYVVVEYGSPEYLDATGFTKEETEQMQKEVDEKKDAISEASKYNPIFIADDNVGGTLYSENNNILYSTDNGRNWHSVENGIGKIGGGLDSEKDILYKHSEDGEIQTLNVEKMEKNPLDRNQIEVNNGIMSGIPDGYEVRKEGTNTWIKVDGNTFTGEKDTSYYFRKSAKGNFMASDESFVVTVTSATKTTSSESRTSEISTSAKETTESKRGSEAFQKKISNSESVLKLSSEPSKNLEQKKITGKKVDSDSPKAIKVTNPNEQIVWKERVIFKKDGKKKILFSKYTRGRKLKDIKFVFNKSKVSISKKGFAKLKNGVNRTKVKIHFLFTDTTSQTVELSLIRK